MSAKSGFTLIELLVVITIMALVGAYALSNFGSFGKDQKLKNAVLDVVSLLRQAQSNATTGAKCQGQVMFRWLVDYTGGNFNLKCQYKDASGATITSSSLKTPSFPSGYSSGISGTCLPSTSIIFTPLSGTIAQMCNPNSITITVTNPEGSSQVITVEKGGRIYAQ